MLIKFLKGWGEAWSEEQVIRFRSQFWTWKFMVQSGSRNWNIYLHFWFRQTSQNKTLFL